jgi:hypothetical protein
MLPESKGRLQLRTREVVKRVAFGADVSRYLRASPQTPERHSENALFSLCSVPPSIR